MDNFFIFGVFSESHSYKTFKKYYVQTLIFNNNEKKKNQLTKLSYLLAAFFLNWDSVINEFLQGLNIGA